MVTITPTAYRAGDERNLFAEITSDPRYGDRHNFYKVETWTLDGHWHAPCGQ